MKSHKRDRFPPPSTGITYAEASNPEVFAGYTWNLDKDDAASWALKRGSSAATTLPYFRAECRSGDTWSGDVGAPAARNRAEFQNRTRAVFGDDNWFSYAFRIVSGEASTAPFCVLNQWHHTPDEGDSGNSPPFAINYMTTGILRFIRRFSSDTPTTTVTQSNMHDTSVVARDLWHHIVGRLKFGFSNDAVVQLWFNGQQIVNLSNTNMGYNDVQGPYAKFGIYRSEAPETLVVEYANMELGTSSLLARVTSPLAV